MHLSCLRIRLGLTFSGLSSACWEMSSQNCDKKGRCNAICKRNLKISSAKVQNFFILAVSDLYLIRGARIRIRNSATRSTGTWYLRNVTQFPQIPVAVRHLFFKKNQHNFRFGSSQTFKLAHSKKEKDRFRICNV
jgi:hypothetical protein